MSKLSGDLANNTFIRTWENKKGSILLSGCCHFFPGASKKGNADDPLSTETLQRETSCWV